MSLINYMSKLFQKVACHQVRDRAEHEPIIDRDTLTCEAKAAWMSPCLKQYTVEHLI